MSIKGGDRLHATVYDETGDIIARGIAVLPFGEHKEITLRLSPEWEIIDGHTYWLQVERVR